MPRPHTTADLRRISPRDCAGFAFKRDAENRRKDETFGYIRPLLQVETVKSELDNEARDNKMNRNKGRSRFSRLVFYVAVIVLAVVSWRFTALMNARSLPVGTIIATSDSTMSPWDDKAMRAYSDMSSLLTTLGTAMLGAVGFLLANRRKTSHVPHLWSALLGATCVGLSIYFGYVCHLYLLAAAASRTFDPYNLSTIWPSRAQFYSLLMAVFFFADFAFHDLGGEVLSEHA